MKKIAVLLFCLSLLIVGRAAENKSAFLFSEYQSAEIVYTNGSQTNQQVNYNLLEEKLYFIDQADKQVKIVSDVSNIAVIHMNNQSYFIDNSSIRQIVMNEPVELSVQFIAKRQVANPTVGYGGTSGVASVTTYTHFREGGQQSILKEPEINLQSIDKCYWIVLGTKTKKFMDKKQFVKIYADKKALLMQYIEEKKTDFDKIDQVIDLVKYAESLK